VPKEECVYAPPCLTYFELHECPDVLPIHKNRQTFGPTLFYVFGRQDLSGLYTIRRSLSGECRAGLICRPDNSWFSRMTNSRAFAHVSGWPVFSSACFARLPRRFRCIHRKPIGRGTSRQTVSLFYEEHRAAGVPISIRCTSWPVHPFSIAGTLFGISMDVVEFRLIFCSAAGEASAPFVP
jgi:hypothetical protein